MAVHNQEKKGRILTIEHPTDSSPALMVFSGNAGQLLRGDIPTINILKAMRQRAQRNDVAFVMHFQEAGAIRKNSVGMTRLLEDVFGDEVTIFHYGPQESNGQIRIGLDQYTVSSKNLSIRARSVVLLPVVERNLMRRNQRAAVNTSYDYMLPNGELGYLETTGFHYDLGLTPISARVSRLQAVETRLGVEKLIQQDINPPLHFHPTPGNHPTPDGPPEPPPQCPPESPSQCHPERSEGSRVEGVLQQNINLPQHSHLSPGSHPAPDIHPSPNGPPEQPPYDHPEPPPQCPPERSEGSHKALESIRGRIGLVTFSGDGNTRGFVGTRWQMDRVEALKKGLGEDVKEATEEISVTANLPHSIQQEFIGIKHPLLKLAGNIIDDVIDTLDETTGSKWGERKLDHQFYRDFTITPKGKLIPLHRFDIIENNVFYAFENADHYFIGTLFGFQMNGDSHNRRM